MIAGVALLILIAALAILSIGDRRLLRGVIATVAYLVAIGLGLILVLNTMGTPKPYALEWPWVGAKEVSVLAAVPVENVAIYVWIGIPGEHEPRSYSLPWSQKTAQQLQDAMNKAEGDGTELRMGMQFDGVSDNSEPMFYAAPQPPMPEKNYTAPVPTVPQR